MLLEAGCEVNQAMENGARLFPDSKLWLGGFHAPPSNHTLRLPTHQVSPLFIACQSGHDAIVRKLLRRQAATHHLNPKAHLHTCVSAGSCAACVCRRVTQALRAHPVTPRDASTPCTLRDAA